MAETPWRKEQLSNGASAYIISCKQSPEKPLMIHFGLRTCQLVICGQCMCGRLFDLVSNYKDVANWCRRHWRSFAKSDGAIAPHDTTQCHSEDQLRQMLALSSGATSKRHTIGMEASGTPRSILLPETWLVDIFGTEKIQELKGDQPKRHLVSICNVCLKEANGSGCCQGSRLITVLALKAGKRMEALYCTKSASGLTHEAEIQARLAENGSPIPPPPPSYPPPLLPASTSIPATSPQPLITYFPPPSLPHMTPGPSASTSTTSSHYSPVPFPSLGAFQPATVVPTSHSSIQNLLGEGREYVSLLYIDPMFVEESKAFVDQNGGVCSVEGTRRGKKGHDRDDPERELLERLKFPGGRLPDPNNILQSF